MIIYRRMIKKEMSKDLDSKVSDAVNVYFKLNKPHAEITD